MIAPIMIVCKKRYAECAVIAVETFLEHHNTVLYVVVDELAEKTLSGVKSEQLCLVPIKKYLDAVVDEIKVEKFHSFQYDKHGKHDRAYSSLKPLIMDKVISELSPQSKYVLSLDADTIFTGNILCKVKNKVNKQKHKFDLYMVERADKRMSLLGKNTPGSGFTLWKRSGKFIETFRQQYKPSCAGKGGGSQDLINRIRKKLVPSMLFKDPLLHFISPDYGFSKKNPMSYPAKQILKLKPAYIHLHGANSYERLVRFREIFKKHGE